MSNEKYEPIKFNSWQELAKYVIDGGEVYFQAADHKRINIGFHGAGFNCDLERVFANRDTYTRRQPTLKELIAVKPRLFWVWNGLEIHKKLRLVEDLEELQFVRVNWQNHRMLTDDEIKQFLDKEPS